MSKNWFHDMTVMHQKYGVDKWMETEKVSDWSLLRQFMDFRISMMEEELAETKKAVQDKNA